MAQSVVVKRTSITEAQVQPHVLPDLAPEAVRLRVESFSITANNVTYAVFGEAMRYWQFFPAPQTFGPEDFGPEDFGIVPMWGHAIVEHSRHADIAVGERVYGYLPMASHVDVQPGKVKPDSFMDMAAHRQALSPVYNQYRRLAGDEGHDPTREEARMLFEPLFKTGYLIESMFARAAWHGAAQLIMTSASSKTAMALAHVAKTTSAQIKRIGLTSAANLAFVRATGLYDEVLAYEDVTTLARAASVSVDFAGNGKLLAALHHHLQDALAYSCLVGATHLDARGGSGGASLPGPQPILFFAPDHIAAIIKDIGLAQFTTQVTASWKMFLSATDGLVTVRKLHGLEAAAQAWRQMATGKIKPDIGIIVQA
jgi:hypothetical protein